MVSVTAWGISRMLIGYFYLFLSLALSLLLSVVGAELIVASRLRPTEGRDAH